MMLLPMSGSAPDMRAMNQRRPLPLLILLCLPFLLLLAGHGSARAEPHSGGYWPVLNIKASTPQAVSLEFGMAYQFRENQDSDSGIGPFISYEPGINGQKAHLGIAYTRITGFIDAIYVVKVSASYYRAWRDSSGMVAGDEMYGAEVTGTYGIFLVSGGLYYSRDKDRYTGAIGAGIGW